MIEFIEYKAEKSCDSSFDGGDEIELGWNKHFIDDETAVDSDPSNMDLQMRPEALKMRRKMPLSREIWFDSKVETLMWEPMFPCETKKS